MLLGLLLAAGMIALVTGLRGPVARWTAESWRMRRKLGVESSLACRPYDLACWLVATEAGCVLRDPFGEPLDIPLDVTTNIAFACYANETLAGHMVPIVREETMRHLDRV